jgi:hypothetical protein
LLTRGGSAKGETAAHVAVAQRQEGCLQELLGLGGEVAFADAEGLTPAQVERQRNACGERLPSTGSPQ